MNKKKYLKDYYFSEDCSKINNYSEETIKKMENHYKEIIHLLGEDTNREGLLKTPERVAKAMNFLMQGYNTKPEEILKSSMFAENYREMVIVKDIELYSMCEHHLLPFFGKAHVAYIPDGYLVGISKISRVIDAYARRLQVQERLTSQIKECIQKTIKPLGVAVVIEAHHLCMMMRGIQKQNSVVTTSDFTGAFKKEETRAEFLQLISRNNLH